MASKKSAAKESLKASLVRNETQKEDLAKPDALANSKSKEALVDNQENTTQNKMNDDVDFGKCPCCSEIITDAKDREISKRVLLLMQDEPTFLKEVNEYRKAFNVGKVNPSQAQDFFMCSACILAVLSGQRAMPPSKKDIFVDKLSEPLQ